MSKFKLTQTAAEVQDILNNSLQKPTGLAKTKLVGVGVNGQENIEIGDNLTLANGKLSATGGGRINGLQSDAEGNLTASKNLEVDGKLKLKSLISDTNTDGDITKELGGGSNLYEYNVLFLDNKNLGIDRIGKFYSSVDIGRDNITRTTTQIFQQLIPGGSQYMLILPVFGAIKITEGENTTYYSLINLKFGGGGISLYYLDPAKGEIEKPNDFLLTSQWSVTRNIASPRKGNG